MNCPFCDHNQLYILENEYRKCKQCNKKFSLRKYQTDLKVIELFCNNVNALEVSSRLNLNYRTVKNRYDVFRRLIANYLEALYASDHKENSAYEEYYYFTVRQNQKKRKSLFDAINVIGFYTNQRVYTLLMPKLQKPFDSSDDKNYQAYLTWHKLQSKEAYKTPLSVFWRYLEENLKKYKGVNEKNFFFYLKECEFKFNFLYNKQIEILKELYFKM